MQVGHLDTCGEDGIVGMLSGKGCSSLGCKFIELSGSDTLIDSLNHLLRDDGFVYELE